VIVIVIAGLLRVIESHSSWRRSCRRARATICRC